MPRSKKVSTLGATGEETEFSFYSGRSDYDSRHVSNLRPKKNIPADLIKKMYDDGLTIEKVGELTKQDFPVCKYRTQITVHGIAPELNDKRNKINEYSCFVVNKNKSLGVKWTGIDAEKKRRIGKLIEDLSAYDKLQDPSIRYLWRFNIDSTGFRLRLVVSKCKIVNICGNLLARPNDEDREKAEQIAKKLSERIKGLYYGDVCVHTTAVKYVGGGELVVDVEINGIYEADVDEFVARFKDISHTEIKRRVDFVKTKRDEETAAVRARYTAKEQREKESYPVFKAEYDKAVEDFKAFVPKGFEYKLVTPKEGLIIGLEEFPDKDDFRDWKTGEYRFNPVLFAQRSRRKFLMLTLPSKARQWRGKDCYSDGYTVGAPDKVYFDPNKKYLVGKCPYPIPEALWRLRDIRNAVKRANYKLRCKVEEDEEELGAVVDISIEKVDGVLDGNNRAIVMRPIVPDFDSNDDIVRDRELERAKDFFERTLNQKNLHNDDIDFDIMITGESRDEIFYGRINGRPAPVTRERLIAIYHLKDIIKNMKFDGIAQTDNGKPKITPKKQKNTLLLKFVVDAMIGRTRYRIKTTVFTEFKPVQYSIKI